MSRSRDFPWGGGGSHTASARDPAIGRDSMRPRRRRLHNWITAGPPRLPHTLACPPPADNDESLCIPLQTVRTHGQEAQAGASPPRRRPSAPQRWRRYAPSPERERVGRRRAALLDDLLFQALDERDHLA